MYDNQIEIKERRKGLVAKGLIFLSFMLISLFVAFFPFLFKTQNATLFYAIGGSMFFVFLLLYLFQIIKACKPNNAIVLSSNGFVDLLNVGSSVKIEWTNVSSVKMLGKGDTPFLGIVLENSDIVISKMSKNKADIMRENIEEGLPAILIAQTEVRTPIKELRDLFVRFVRESRALENETPTKTKVNPFSSEDVLRAFGKLPAKEEKGAEQEATDETNTKITVIPQSSDDFYNSLKEKTSDAQDTPLYEAKATETIANESTSELQGLPIDNDQPTEVNEPVDEEVPQEIAELLSKAKSSKIAEIGKILTDNDVPFSVARPNQCEDNDSSIENTEEISESAFSLDNIDTDEIEETLIDNSQAANFEEEPGESNLANEASPSFVFPAEFYNQDDVEESQRDLANDLGSMLAKAFNDIENDNSVVNKEEVIAEEPNDEAKEDTQIEPKAVESVDYYPELVFINDSDFEDDDDYISNSSLMQDGTDNFNGGFITNIDDD